MSRQFRPGQLQTGSIYDITASYALNADISGLVATRIATGSLTASVFTGTSSFLITSASLRLFEITETGIAIFATQSSELPSGSAPYGGIYFTSSSMFVGLEP